MKYVLVRCNSDRLEIQESTYAELEKATKILWLAFLTESRYELLMLSYIDFENEIMKNTVKNMIREVISYTDFVDSYLILSLRLINILTVVRMYLDQVPSLVRDLILTNDTNIDTKNANTIKDKIKQLKKHEYENNLDYQIMEKLRNYTQHKGMPLDRVSTRSRLVKDGLAYSTGLWLSKSSLEEDGVLKEEFLNKMGEETNLILATRSYIESISKIHEKLRKMISEPTNHSRKLIEDVHTKFNDEYGNSKHYLRAEIWEGNKKISRTELHLNWDDARVELQNKNIKLINLRKSYVTGEEKQ